ncbi:unnamed protein product, partial [Prunus brigantina]
LIEHRSYRREPRDPLSFHTNQLRYILIFFFGIFGMVKSRLNTPQEHNHMLFRHPSSSTLCRIMFVVQRPYKHSPSENRARMEAHWGPKVDVVVFCFLDLASNYEPPDSLAEWLEAGEQPVYIGFDSLPLEEPEKMTNIILQALEITGQRGVINRGWGGLGNYWGPKVDVVVFCFLDLASNYEPPDSLAEWLEAGEQRVLKNGETVSLLYAFLPQVKKLQQQYQNFQLVIVP